jgi:RHS repeat-associated protein
MSSRFLLTALSILHRSNRKFSDYKFTGKERDSESGLDNFGARYDSSQYGRFMTPDPSGIWLANLSDPQSIEVYRPTEFRMNNV